MTTMPRDIVARVESLLSARLFLVPQLAGDRVFFVSNLSGRLSLYAMDAGGSVPEPLLPPGVALQNPELIGGDSFAVLPGIGPHPRDDGPGRRRDLPAHAVAHVRRPSRAGVRGGVRRAHGPPYGLRSREVRGLLPRRVEGRRGQHGLPGRPRGRGAHEARREPLRLLPVRRERVAHRGRSHGRLRCRGQRPVPVGRRRAGPPTPVRSAPRGTRSRATLSTQQHLELLLRGRRPRAALHDVAFLRHVRPRVHEPERGLPRSCRSA